MNSEFGSKEVLAAVLAVIFGWALGVLGSSVRALSNRRMAAARALSKLAPLYDSLQSIGPVIERVLEFSKSPTDHEEKRSNFLNKYAKPFLLPQTAVFEPELTALASYWPMLAMDVRASFVRLDKLLSLRYPATAEVHLPAYATFTSFGEVALELETRNFRKLLRKVAFHCGLVTYLSFLLRMSAQKRNRKKSAPTQAMLDDAAQQLIDACEWRNAPNLDRSEAQEPQPHKPPTPPHP